MTLAIQTFVPGQRVVTTGHVDNFPVIIVRPGEVGTVDEVVQEGDFLRIMVAMDHHFPELAEWDNCLEVTVYPNDEAPLAVVEDRDPVRLNIDSPSCAVAIAEAVRSLAGEVEASTKAWEKDRLLATIGTLQAILMQRGCVGIEGKSLTELMDEAIFG